MEWGMEKIETWKENKLWENTLTNSIIEMNDLI